MEFANQENIKITDGMERMDFDRVTEMLSGAYWCGGIQKAEVLQSAAGSALVVGVFDGDRQIGYSRVISDKTRFAYISDVFIDEEYRSLGLGQQMVEYILSHESLKDVYQWLLFTKNAHEVYKRCGFAPTSRPDDCLEIRRPRPNR